MPNDRTTHVDKLLLHPGMQQKGTNQTGSAIARPLLSARPVPAPVYRDVRNQGEHPILKILFTLLVILCMYCLGSLSLASHLLPSAFFHSQLLSSSPSLAASTADGGGECTAAPNNLNYLPPLPGATQDSALPQGWLKAGYNDKDFAYARACAASFTVAYLSFDFNHASTFEASESMLSTGGQQRFYGHASKRSADSRLDPLWRASIQKEQLRQSAQTYPPVLLQAQFEHERMLAWMQIHYQLTIYRSNGVFNRDDYMTVLVISAPRNT